jgi:CMP-2-keto-3-deoxyoctulosonic acid synthetase
MSKLQHAVDIAAGNLDRAVKHLDELNRVNAAALKASESRVHSDRVANAVKAVTDAERELDRADAFKRSRELIPPMEDHYASARGSLVHEGTYGPDSGPSFFRDMVYAREHVGS